VRGKCRRGLGSWTGKCFFFAKEKLCHTYQPFCELLGAQVRGMVRHAFSDPIMLCTTFKQTGKKFSDINEIRLSKNHFSHSFPHPL
jgi:hypothetical protein